MKKINKMCSFYVNGWHLIIMILPYICKKIYDNEIIIISEEDLIIHVKSILEKLNLNEEMKNNILKINWNKTNNIENRLNRINNKSEIFVIGSKEFIEKTNEKIENINKIVTIINCFEVLQFNQNMEEILSTHEKVLNTSGIRDIEDLLGNSNNEKVI